MGAEGRLRPELHVARRPPALRRASAHEERSVIRKAGYRRRRPRLKSAGGHWWMLIALPAEAPDRSSWMVQVPAAPALIESATAPVGGLIVWSYWDVPAPSQRRIRIEPLLRPEAM